MNDLIIEKILINGLLNEINLHEGYQDNINKRVDDYAQQIFGSEYGKVNPHYNKYALQDDLTYDDSLKVKNDAKLSGGLLSLGNTKLADKQTLIINFNSGLGCPSMNMCPIKQDTCYAVAGEIQYDESRRKRMYVQNLMNYASKNDMNDAMLVIARIYIDEIEKSQRKQKIKFIRFNEAGDFPNQKVLDACAKFAFEVKDKGIYCMAYTARKDLDFTKIVDGTTAPIDQIIAVNRSRYDIKTSDGGLNRKFLGTGMGNFSTNPEVNLENAYSDVIEVTTHDLQNLQVNAPQKNKQGIPSVPILSHNTKYGYYYICPCSFWFYKKEMATKEFFIKCGKMSPDEELPASKNTNQGKEFYGRLTSSEKEQLKKILSKIISPCGTHCAVCHDTSGGIYKGQTIKDYCVLTNIHGAGKSNYDPEYASLMQQGDKGVEQIKAKRPVNPFGHNKKFDILQALAQDWENNYDDIPQIIRTAVALNKTFNQKKADGKKVKKTDKNCPSVMGAITKAISNGDKLSPELEKAVMRGASPNMVNAMKKHAEYQNQFKQTDSPIRPELLAAGAKDMEEKNEIFQHQKQLFTETYNRFFGKTIF